MLDVTRLLAHAGEEHETAVEAQSHYLQEWYFALPLLVVAIALIATAAYFLSGKSKAVTLLSVSASLLIGGVAFYNVSATASIVALAAGLAVTLVSVLISLGKE